MTCIVEKRGADKDFVGNFDGERPLRMFSHRWQYNFKMELQEVVWSGLIWLILGTGSVLLLMQL